MRINIICSKWNTFEFDNYKRVDIQSRLMCKITRELVQLDIDVIDKSVEDVFFVNFYCVRQHNCAHCKIIFDLIN